MSLKITNKKEKEEEEANNTVSTIYTTIVTMDSRNYKRSQNGKIIFTHCNETVLPEEYILDDWYEGLDDAYTDALGQVRCFWIVYKKTESGDRYETESGDCMWIEKRLLTPKLVSHVDDSNDGITNNIDTDNIIIDDEYNNDDASEDTEEDSFEQQPQQPYSRSMTILVQVPYEPLLPGNHMVIDLPAGQEEEEGTTVPFEITVPGTVVPGTIIPVQVPTRNMRRTMTTTGRGLADTQQPPPNGGATTREENRRVTLSPPSQSVRDSTKKRNRSGRPHQRRFLATRKRRTTHQVTGIEDGDAAASTAARIAVIEQRLAIAIQHKMYMEAGAFQEELNRLTTLLMFHRAVSNTVHETAVLRGSGSGGRGVSSAPGRAGYGHVVVESVVNEDRVDERGQVIVPPVVDRTTVLRGHVMVESVVKEDRVDERGQVIVPAVVDGNFTRQEDNDPRYWIEKFLPSTKITNNEETRLKCSHSGCLNSACCQWKKNSHIPNDYYFCYDHFPPWNLTTESGQRSHFPDKIDIRVDLTVWNNNAGYKQNVRLYCTSDQGLKDGTKDLEVAKHRRLNPGDNDIPQLGIQFTSLSVNNNKPSLTPSQWTRDGKVVGLGEFELFAGPYTRIIVAYKEKVTEFAVEVEREVSWTDPVGDTQVKKLHCMYCNYFLGDINGGKGYIPRLKDSVPAPYWNNTKNCLELGTTTMYVTVTRIPFLNQFWQICLEWAKVNKTNEGMPKFSDFQMDHRCHSRHCVNTNHIVLSRRCKLSEGVNTNFVRDKCVGPPFCKCGERGVPCLIPGSHQKGYRCVEFSEEDLVRMIIARPSIYPSNGIFDSPKPWNFLNHNYAYNCIPFRPKLDEKGESVIVKIACYQCQLESRIARPELSSAQRTLLKKNTVGWYNKKPKCKICRNCGLILCDKHQIDDKVNHYDVAYMKNQLDAYKIRCDDYFNK